MLTQLKGLILGERTWGEHDKLLTVLTAEKGKLGVVIKGGESLKNKVGGACLPFSYSELTVAERGGRPWVREASEIRGFHSIRTELEKTALALYILDVVTEENDEAEMLQLALNTLHAIETDLKPLSQIKAAFELRTAAVCGFSPDLVACSVCGNDGDSLMYLDVMDGVMTCRKCKDARRAFPPEEGHTTLILLLDRPLLDAMRMVAYSPAKKFLSFELPEEDNDLFFSHCEKYLLNQIERGFNSLEFLHSLKDLPPPEAPIKKKNTLQNSDGGTDTE